MAKDPAVFGFDELEKKFEKMADKWPNEVSRVLKVSANKVVQIARSKTNIGPLRKTRSGDTSRPGRLKRSWRARPERYRIVGGEVIRWVRVSSDAPHSHLVNLGHELWVGGQGKVSTRKMYIPGRGVFERPSRQHKNSIRKGRVEGKFIINKAKKTYMDKFGGDIEKAFDKLTKGQQI